MIFRMRPFAFVLLVLLISALSAEAATPVIDACRAVPLKDAASGAAIRGPEDVDVVRSGDGNDLLLISAHDRWAYEDAIDEGRTPPKGGLYAVPAAALAGGGTLKAQDLTADWKRDRDFRPHGISVHRSASGEARLFVLNHAETAAGRETRLEVFDVLGAGLSASLRHMTTVTDAALCRANDVAAVSAIEAVVTRDRGACDAGIGRLIEDTLGLADGRLLRVILGGGSGAVEDLPPRISFPNGIAHVGGGRLKVAATREKAIYDYHLAGLLRGDDGALAQTPVDGGPDNLSVGLDGAVLAAVHPSLLAIGFGRNRWLGRERAPSRLIHVGPDGRVTPLFDDADGTRYSAATSVTETEGHYVAGSVLEDRLLVCRKGGVIQ